MVNQHCRNTVPVEQPIEIAATARDANVVTKLCLRTGQIHRRVNMPVQPVRVIENMQNSHETHPNITVNKYKAFDTGMKLEYYLLFPDYIPSKSRPSSNF